MNDPRVNKRGAPILHNEAGSSFIDVNEELDHLIERTEKRLSKVEEKLNSGELTRKQEWKYTDAFTKLVGTLRALYALKRGQIQPEEEDEDLAKILSDLEKEAKLHIKDQRGQKRGKQFEKVEPEQTGQLLVLAVCDAIGMCHRFLHGGDRYAIAVRLECARLLPSLIQAVRLLAGHESVAEGMVS